MSFKYSVIGDNTPENKEWIKKIGWELKYMREDADTIVTSSNTGLFSCIVSDQTTWFSNFISESIDCRKNPDLFKAVSAMRTTTDIGKYYINNHTGQWKLCDYNMATDENIDWGDWTEATLAELQAHFQRV